MAQPSQAGARQRVLIVDDDPELREVLSIVLGDRYDVSAAGNGRDALIEMAEAPADAVVLDLAMPVLDGEAYMAEHRRLHAEVPVVVISATGAIAVTALRLGASAWLRKPFELSALERELAALLPDHRATP